MSDMGYRIILYSDIRYNVGILSLQFDIGSSNIKLSQYRKFQYQAQSISLITDIGLSAHHGYSTSLLQATG